MIVGVLALQGDFAEHMRVLHSLNLNAQEVRTLDDLAHIDRLIIPGGESTVMSRFLVEEGLMEEIRTRSVNGKLPILGTCAGAILLAKTVTGKNPPQALELMDISVERNAYGTQLDSFAEEIDVVGIGKKRVSFIRAPKIMNVESDVRVLASHQGAPILVQQGDLLAATFHTEVKGDTWLHELFLNQ